MASSQYIKLLVKNLTVPCRIGIHQHERLAPQKIRVNVELLCWIPADLNDDYDRTICYADLIMRIKSVIGKSHFNLVETIAEQIAQDCLQIEAAREALVRIEKLDQFKDAESVGVEVRREKLETEQS